jgi:hypothetical protein
MKWTVSDSSSYQQMRGRQSNCEHYRSWFKRHTKFKQTLEVLARFVTCHLIHHESQQLVTTAASHGNIMLTKKITPQVCCTLRTSLVSLGHICSFSISGFILVVLNDTISEQQIWNFVTQVNSDALICFFWGVGGGGGLWKPEILQLVKTVFGPMSELESSWIRCSSANQMFWKSHTAVWGCRYRYAKRQPH